MAALEDPAEPQAQPSAAVPAIRISDTEREAVVEVLRCAHVEGRLTLEEMSARVEAAYVAKVASELEPLTADLPAAGPAAQAAQLATAGGPATETVAAVFGGAERKGRWRVPRHTRVVAVFGGVALDLREAQLAAPEVTMTVTAAFGGVEIVVPEGVEVQLSGWSLFGGKAANVPPSPPGAPVVRVRATAIFGGVQVRARSAHQLER